MMFDYSDGARKRILERLENQTVDINNAIRLRDELQSRMNDPEALYFCGFEMKPNFVKLGDHVYTKYGDKGKVVIIDPEKELITIATGGANAYIELGTDRISSLFYENVKLESVPHPEDPYFD